MWLNEGWASFSEYLFTEALYGRKAYEDMVKEQHLEIIHYGFARDGGNYFHWQRCPMNIPMDSLPIPVVP